MKHVILSICLCVVFAGCHDSEMDPSPIPNLMRLDKPDETIPFKLNPTATDKLTISFWHTQERALKSLTMLKGTEKLLTVDFTRPSGGDVFTTDINYAFQEDESYDFLLETVAVNDTLFTYHLNNYQHTFVQTFVYQKMDDWTQMLEYDIDPERKFLFITDYINNEFVFKRISLEDFTIQTFPNHFYSAPIRAISDNEIITYSRFYNGRFLLADSAALLLHNLNSGTSQFIDWISADYIRISRIVNNHIIFNNPIFTSKTSTLIDLADQSKKTFLNDELNPLSFRNENFDNLYSGNNIFDWGTETFVEKVNASENSFISYIDNTGQHVFAMETIFGPDNKYYHSRLLAYEGNSLIYEGPFEKNCSYTLGLILDVSDNKVIFFKDYGFDTVPRISGYYSLDLATGEAKLVHCDNYDFVKRDFALTTNTIMSVRHNGLYKITIN